MTSVADEKYKGLPIGDGLSYNTGLFLLPGCYQNDLSAILIPEGMIRDRVKCLAYEIHQHVTQCIGDEPLVILCVLKGSYRFFTLLVDELSVARRDCQHGLSVEFIRVKSYENTESTGSLQIVGLSNMDDLKGRNILIVEDIVDSGRTLHQLLNALDDLKAAKVWTAILVSKRVDRQSPVQEDFVAFNIPDEFVVGFGLDYNQRFRDLGHICIMSASGIAKYKQTK